MARTDREKELITRFVDSYNLGHSTKYRIVSWPDDDSSAKAIDAIANDLDLGTLAIEHTIVQPFQGEKADSAIFLRSIAALDQKPEMLLPGFDVDLTMTVGAIPKGVKWGEATEAVKNWYLGRDCQRTYRRRSELLCQPMVAAG